MVRVTRSSVKNKTNTNNIVEEFENKSKRKYSKRNKVSDVSKVIEEEVIEENEHIPLDERVYSPDDMELRNRTLQKMWCDEAFKGIKSINNSINQEENNIENVIEDDLIIDEEVVYENKILEDKDQINTKNIKSSSSSSNEFKNFNSNLKLFISVIILIISFISIQYINSNINNNLIIENFNNNNNNHSLSSKKYDINEVDMKIDILLSSINNVISIDNNNNNNNNNNNKQNEKISHDELIEINLHLYNWFNKYNEKNLINNSTYNNDCMIKFNNSNDNIIIFNKFENIFKDIISNANENNKN
jgi:hypothetical protein